jgi:drug/metabolite transporter (DMT)-like permease
MNQKTLAIFAAIAANSIYGINFTIGKNLMPEVIEPYGFAFFRVSGAAVLFLLLSLFFPSEKIDRNDMLRFIACGLFGMSINMTMLFKGLSLSTPINGSIIITLTPVIILIMSAVFLKEKTLGINILELVQGLLELYY